MKVYKTIHFETKNNKLYTIYFGEPTEEREMDEMFKLRYDVYVEHGYFRPEQFPNGRERDEYDAERKCTYFIAKINNDVVGSVRFIHEKYLPTETYCFQFEEPEAMKKIPRDKRVELSRLVARKYKIEGEFLPRHLVLIGLLATALESALRQGIEGGYGFSKSSLNKKLIKLGIPFHFIKPYKQVYNREHLRPYFSQEGNPVSPVYFLREESARYFHRLLNNRLIFEKINDNEYKFKKVNKFKLLLFRMLPFS